MKLTSIIFMVWTVLTGCSGKSAVKSEVKNAVAPETQPAPRPEEKPAVKPDLPSLKQTPEVTPKVPVLAWDFPVIQSVVVPACTDDRIFHQNETTYFAVKKFKNNLSVRKFENGVMKMKQAIWATDLKLVTTDGHLVTIYQKFLKYGSFGDEDYSDKGTSRFPLATTVSGLFGVFVPVVSQLSGHQAPALVSKFILGGDSFEINEISLSVFDSNLQQIGKSTHVGRICPSGNGPSCLEKEIFFFPDAGEVLHAVWVQATSPNLEWSYVIRDFSVATGRALGPARNLKTSVEYSAAPLGDRIREEVEGDLVCKEWGHYFVRTRSILYENLKPAAKTVFDVNCRTHNEDYKKCKLGSIKLEMQTPSGPKTVDLLDDETNGFLSKLCTKRLPNLFLGGFQVERRPGGGYLVLLKINAGQLDNGNSEIRGTYFREYTAEGMPIGPVRQVNFSRIERLSNHSWRAESGCAWEVRSIEKNAH